MRPNVYIFAWLSTPGTSRINLVALTRFHHCPHTAHFITLTTPILTCGKGFRPFTRVYALRKWGEKKPLSISRPGFHVAGLVLLRAARGGGEGERKQQLHENQIRDSKLLYLLQLPLQKIAPTSNLTFLVCRKQDEEVVQVSNKGAESDPRTSEFDS